MSNSAAPKRRAFACSISLFMGRSGSYRQKCRFCTLTGPHPTISTLFYISIHCHVSILSEILSRGIGFERIGSAIMHFGWCTWNGDVFIDRFEWGEVCICTLCAMKHEGGVSNGMWNAKSDGVHKNENAAKRRRCG